MKTSSSAAFQTMKLAWSRPFAEQKPARRASFAADGRDVVRQLALQERRGVGTAGADDAEMGQRHGARGRHGVVHAAIIISARDSFAREVSCLSGCARRCSMKLWRVLLVLLLFLCGATAGAAYWWLNRPLPLAADTVEASIEFGTSPRDIAMQWVQAGVQSSPILLYEWFRWSGESRRIRAGSYEIGRGTTPIALLNKMVRGDETLAVVRFTEGWTFRQMRIELAKAEALKPTTSAMSDAEIMQAIGAPGVPPEGRFFPDTYAYSKGSADLAVLARAYRAMEQRLQSAWAERDARTRR